jgi:MSHA biogenesis protein MshP
MSTTCPDDRFRRIEKGFAIISSIFILVVLAALAAFVVSVTSTQNITLAQNVQAARAYQAAQAGIEWGISRWVAATPDCAAAPDSIITFAGTDLSEFTTTVKRTPPSPIADGGINFCKIESTATNAAAVGSIGYAERQVRAVVEGN